MDDDDEITAAEEGFMMGREQEPQTRKKHVKNRSVMLTLFRLNYPKTTQKTTDHIMRSDSRFNYQSLWCTAISY
jgi:hypothetical protein